MSDRIAVMRGGSFLQIGTPSEVYDSPKNVYAARFIGEANILPCVYEDEIGGRYTVKFGDNKLILRGNKGHYTAGDLIFAAVRGEKILVSAAESGGIPATVKDLNFAGGVMRITAEALGTKITAMRYGLDRSIELGQQVWLEIPELAGAAVEE